MPYSGDGASGSTGSQGQAAARRYFATVRACQSRTFVPHRGASIRHTAPTRDMCKDMAERIGEAYEPDGDRSHKEEGYVV
jgi:hypothetical protein